MIDFTTEHEIRETARDLARLYEQLSAAVRAPAPEKEIRVMAPRPGPSEPGNLTLISLDHDLVSHLHEVVRDACNYIEPSRILTWDGTELCNWVAFNSQAISNLDFADDLLEEMQTQARNLNRRLNPPQPADLARQPEKYITTEAIIRNLTHRGHTVTARQARDVATYNKFDICKFQDQRNGYKLTEFLRHYEKKGA